MIKRLVCLWCALIICFGMVRVECCAAGIDVNHSCSLTLSYTRNGKAFSELEIEVYRVAELCDNGMYKLLVPFSYYPIKIYGITSQQEWRDTAQTIKNYVVSDQIEPCKSQKTDSQGQVSFTNLKTGLYMVRGTTARNDDGVVIFEDFMVYLPTPEGDGYDYDIEAKPKYTEYVQPTRYTVVKLWKDSDSSVQRPEFVCVEILKDGVVQTHVMLNSGNNWSYGWDVADGDGVWSVIEKDVPEGYLVSITTTGKTFVITNTKMPSIPDKPDDPNKPNLPDVSEDLFPETPETGDTSPILLYLIIMCVSGFGLMILGVLKLRERKNEKKR